MRMNKAGHDNQTEKKCNDLDIYNGIFLQYNYKNWHWRGIELPGGKGGTELPVGLSPCRGKACV